MASANMYRVGDYVYFESIPTSSYLIRRIEELNKTSNGLVEAKVMCFFRRRDLPTNITGIADRHCAFAEEEDGGKDKEGYGFTPKQKHLLRHRELFLSRQVETLPASQIRGKCNVYLLNETESLLSYLQKEDAFFYSLVYDPLQKTLLADRGEIRVGSRFQVESLRPKLKEDETDERKLEDLESLVWTPDHGLTDKQIDQFLVISRSVGTFARALDCSSSIKQPSLHMSAAAASRDVTLFHAMSVLHKSKYDVAKAAAELVPSTGPVLCRDEMEEWSASEANLFEEALEKYGKDFHEIRSDFLPWKTLKNIVEYYYMWKTTDRYVQQKRVKAAEAETKLKQVYVPSFNKPNPAAIVPNKGVLNGSTPEQMISGKPCESCLCTVSNQWYAWNSPTGFQTRLCSSCWSYWRRYGGLKVPNKLHDALKMADGEMDFFKKKAPFDEETFPAAGITVDRAPGLLQPKLHKCAVNGCGKDFKMKSQLSRHYIQMHGLARPNSPRMKTRTAFYLHTTPMTRVARRMCSDILKPRHATRAPFWPINVGQIKQECQTRVQGKSPSDLRSLIKGRKRLSSNAKVSEVAHKLGQSDRVTPEWLILTEKSKLPLPDVEAFPKPPKGPDGSLIYERIPDKHYPPFYVNNLSPGVLKRKTAHVEDVNGLDGPPSKRLAWEGSGAGSGGAPVKISSRSGSPLPLVSQHLPATAAMNSRTVLNHMNGKPKVASIARVGGSRKQIIAWNDAPDDLYFHSTDQSRRIRRVLTTSELRRIARKPCKKVIAKTIENTILSTPLPVPVPAVPQIPSVGVALSALARSPPSAT